MKKLFLIIVCAGAAWANQGVQGFCEQGNIAVQTAGLPSTNVVQGSFPSCTVSVFTAGTTNLVTIFADNINTPLSNPFTANANGHWTFYSASNQRLDIQLSGGGLPSSWKIADVILSDPATALTFSGNNTFSGTNTFSGPLVNTGTDSGNQTITGNKTITGTTLTTQLNGCQYVDASQTFAQALAAVSTPGCIDITPGTYPISVNTTIPANVTLRSTSGGLLSIANAVTLTFTNSASGSTAIVAPPSKIFSYTGSGVVVGLTGTVEAAWFPGADIGAQSNAAIAACQPISGGGCTLHIGAGSMTGQDTLTFTTQINYPMVAGGAGNFQIKCDAGVLLSYTGTAFAIEAKATAANQQNAANVRISGCHIQGSAAGLGGIHLYGAGSGHLTDLDISLFSGQNAQAILNEGSVNVQIDGISNLRANSVGEHDVCVALSFGGTSCASGLTSSGVHWQANTGPGLWEDPGPQSGSSTVNSGNIFMGVAEGNQSGTGAVTPCSGTCTGAASGSTITITVPSTTGLTFGMVAVQSGFSNSACYNGTFTIGNIASTTTYTYTCSGGAATATGGATVISTPQVNIQACNSCNLFSTFMQFGTVSGTAELACVVLGDGSNGVVGINISGFFSCGGATNTIYEYIGTGTVIQSAQEFGSTVTNFYNHATGVGGHSWLGKNFSKATNYYIGSLASVDNVESNSNTAAISKQINGTIQWVEGNAPIGGIASIDSCYGDFTAHLIRCNMNNTGFGPLVTASPCTTSQRTETAADANLLTCVIPAQAGSYRVRFVLNVSAANAATLGWTVNYTDSNGTAVAAPNEALFTHGTATPALTFTTSAAQDYWGSTDIDVNNAAVSIVVKLTFSGTSFTGKASATVERII